MRRVHKVSTWVSHQGALVEFTLHFALSQGGAHQCAHMMPCGVEVSKIMATSGHL